MQYKLKAQLPQPFFAAASLQGRAMRSCLRQNESLLSSLPQRFPLPSLKRE